ncbi:MAG: putative Ig domain-containing protein [bacterium]
MAPCPQASFFTAEKNGENGITVYQKSTGNPEFNKARDIWFKDRRYILPAGDARIHWDKENVIAVRVFDQSGAGGMYAKPFEISMVDLKYHIIFDFSNSAFIYSGDSIVSRKFTVRNVSGKELFKGKLEIRVRLCSDGLTILRESHDLDLQKAAQEEVSFSLPSDLSKPAIAEITFTDNASGQKISASLEIPYILTPKVPEEPRINGAKVFGVRPWSPFLFKVAATGVAPLKYTATGLPDGLKMDETNGVITGTLRKKGEYLVNLKVENSAGVSDGTLKIICGDRISLTPPMGWNSWNCWGLSVSDKKVRQTADAMKSTGLIDHGWTYINIDDGWEYTHDKEGMILTNSKFPNMKALCDYVHSLGLKIGIYSSPGPKTCGGYEGSYTFEEKDAKAYASWGIDYLKYDWCSYGNIAPKPTIEQMKTPYREMKRFIRNAGRDIHYSLCQYGMGNVWKWGAEVDGNSWRTTGDIEDTWESLSSIGFSQDVCSPFAEPGRWNDPDMLVVGMVGWGPELHYTNLTPNEQYLHITLWSMLAAPLLIGCDLSQLDPFTMNLLTNDEVLAVNQDPLGRQATRVKMATGYEIWMKPLEDGSIALGLFNKTLDPVYVPVDLKDLGLSGKHSMRDLWTQQDLGKVRDHFEMKVLPHGARMVSLR